MSIEYTYIAKIIPLSADIVYNALQISHLVSKNEKESKESCGLGWEC